MNGQTLETVCPHSICLQLYQVDSIIKLIDEEIRASQNQGGWQGEKGGRRSCRAENCSIQPLVSITPSTPDLKVATTQPSANSTFSRSGSHPGVGPVGTQTDTLSTYQLLPLHPM